MIFAEVGLNHNGSKSYAQEYVNFHKKADFDIFIPEREAVLKKKNTELYKKKIRQKIGIKPL